jgi:DNA replication protein DnaC
MSDTPQVLLAHHLKALRLPTFLREYDKLARQCAAEGVDHSRYLLRLAELEMIDRERRTVERRIKEAKFPAVKSLDSFDFTAIPSLNKTLVMELARSEYIARRENIIALGNSGTGKTHIALGSDWPHARRVLRWASPPLRLWSTNCTKHAMKSVCCACDTNSLATSC